MLTQTSHKSYTRHNHIYHENGLTQITAIIVTVPHNWNFRTTILRNRNLIFTNRDLSLAHQDLIFTNINLSFRNRDLTDSEERMPVQDQSSPVFQVLMCLRMMREETQEETGVGLAWLLWAPPGTPHKIQ